mmetsp:Transcript_31244/g.61864  ORF Transcript_31244/g.61864 Transcript_31244/m.61864 type:complete len:117 (+) Transcript_31244:164-514(+)|eukprot:CAMPEP_0194304462 /NCGR_PEP_ID=MMETSP0171-20130528/2228_1 /TAXON_ID=218684 /ORGANISM="Corethron pennatum, Strain L29A3" /LENGTH=116 /DNA_ID=CAMNT_0039055771 /DNA_START=148 /DNA_END=498 /DNA_ORIENTATION=+
MSSSAPSPVKSTMHVRCKRRQTTLFVPVLRSTPFGEIKRHILSALGSRGEPCPDSVADVRLYFSAEDDVEKHLPDVGTIADRDVKSDVVLYFVFREGGEADFEIIDAEDLTMDGGV